MAQNFGEIMKINKLFLTLIIATLSTNLFGMNPFKAQKVENNPVCAIDIWSPEIISYVIMGCFELAENEKELATALKTLLVINSSFNQSINQDPEILKTLISRFEQIKKNFFASKNLNYDFMIHRLTPNAQTLLSKTKLLSKIKQFAENKEEVIKPVKFAVDASAKGAKNIHSLLYDNITNQKNQYQSYLCCWLALCNGTSANGDGWWGRKMSPLQSALEAYRSDIALMLLDKGADIKGEKKVYHMDVDPLTFAIEVNMAEAKGVFDDVIEELINKGANVNSANPFYHTALALAWYDLELMKKLLDKGADPFMIIWDGQEEKLKNAYDYALTEGQKIGNTQAAEFLKTVMNKRSQEFANNQKTNCAFCSNKISYDTEVSFIFTDANGAKIYHKDCLIPRLMEIIIKNQK